MSDVTELAWKSYKKMFKSLVEESMEKYDSSYDIMKHYDGNILTGVMIYNVAGNKFYCHELFIDSFDKGVFRRWYNFWQTKADTLVLRTMTLNDKLIKFLSKRGGVITEQNGNNITMEVQRG
jgi:hypothetical protein